MTKRRWWLAVIALVALSVNLRPGATSLGPVLAEALDALGADAAFGGLLTALPGVCFAVFGSLAVAFAARVGLRHALWLGLAAAAAGLLARSVVADRWLFAAGTVVAFAGMAVGNVLAPPFVKRTFGESTASMMTVYAVMLSVGATLGSLLAVPLATLPGGWRASLGAWGVAAGLAALPMLVLAVRARGDRPASGHDTAGLGSLLGSRKAIALGVFFGVQSMQAYVQFGWIAQIYRDGGLDAAAAGQLASLIAAFGIPTGLVVPTLVARLADLRPVVAAFGVLLVAGYLGVWLAPTTVPWLWAIALGLSGGAFPMALALVTARTRDHHVTARLSAFAQTIGYTLAALGPFVVGALFAATGGWDVPLWLLIGSSAVLVWAGFVAVAPGAVDDELGRG